MSLIKSVDVPKYMAEKLRSRRLAARLAGSAVKPAVTAIQPESAIPDAGKASSRS